MLTLKNEFSFVVGLSTWGGGGGNYLGKFIPGSPERSVVLTIMINLNEKGLSFYIQCLGKHKDAS